MAWRIFKYTITPGVSAMRMPAHARVLCAQVQGISIRVWALVEDTDHGLADRVFIVAGTGHRLPDDIHRYVYVGTVQMDGGAIVWHVFTDAEVER